MFFFAAALALSSSPHFEAPATMVSAVPGTNTFANAGSNGPRLAKMGRLVFFTSTATNLDPADKSADDDVFVYDGAKNKLELVRVGDGYVDPIGATSLCGVSENGRIVAFVSYAKNVVPGVQDGVGRAYLHDRTTGHTVLAAKNQNGTPIAGAAIEASLSENGRFLVFVTKSPSVVPGVQNGVAETYLYDVAHDVVSLASVSNDEQPSAADTFGSKVSNDGRFVFFVSTATNLVSSNKNNFADVFVRDMKLGTTARASLGVAGELTKVVNAFEITSNGRVLIFNTSADVLGDGGIALGLYRRDLKTGIVTGACAGAKVAVPGGISNGQYKVSRNGRFLAFITNSTDVVDFDPSSFHADVFLFDAKKKHVEVATFAANGGGIDNDCYSPAVSRDGKKIAFDSVATNLMAPATPFQHHTYLVTR